MREGSAARRSGLPAELLVLLSSTVSALEVLAGVLQRFSDGDFCKASKLICSAGSSPGTAPNRLVRIRACVALSSWSSLLTCSSRLGSIRSPDRLSESLSLLTDCSPSRPINLSSATHRLAAAKAGGCRPAHG